MTASAKARPAPRHVRDMLQIIRLATVADTPLELRKLMTIANFAKLVGWNVTRARRVLMKMHDKSDGDLLVNASMGSRTRWRVSVDAFQRYAPEFVKDRAGGQAAVGLDKVEAIHVRVKRLERQLASLMKERPTLDASKDGWLFPSQMAAILGIETRTVGTIITDLGLRGDIPGICRRVDQTERGAVIRQGKRPTEKTWVAYRYSQEAFVMIRSAVEEAP